MPKIILLFSFFFIQFSVFAKDLVDFDKFTKILAQLESSNNPRAFNKSENAIGIYQIRKLYFIDAQEYDKSLKQYKHEDCYNPEIAKRVVKAYVARYVKTDSFEDFARCHNSGPNWKNKKHLTNNYWARFQKIQNKLSLTPTNK